MKAPKFSSRDAILDTITDGGREPVDFHRHMHLEADEAAAWILFDDIHHPFAERILGSLNVSHATKAKADALLEKLMGNISADDLCELRDVLREVLIDDARAEIVQEGPRYQRKHKLPTATQVAAFDWDELRRSTDRLVYP